MLLLKDEPIFSSVLVGVLPLLLSDTRSSSECWEILSVVSDISFRSATERRPPNKTKEKTTALYGGPRRRRGRCRARQRNARAGAAEVCFRRLLWAKKKPRGSTFCLQITSNTAMTPGSTQPGSKTRYECVVTAAIPPGLLTVSCFTTRFLCDYSLRKHCAKTPIPSPQPPPPSGCTFQATSTG